MRYFKTVLITGMILIISGIIVFFASDEKLTGQIIIVLGGAICFIAANRNKKLGPVEIKIAIPDEKRNRAEITTSLSWGVILGLISILFTTILYMLDQSFNQKLGYIGMAITFIVLSFAMESYRDNVLGGIMPFGKAFGFGALVCIVSALISSIYQIILYQLIDPGLQEKLIQFTIDQMLERGVPEEQIDLVMDKMKIFLDPNFRIFSSFMMAGFFGIILSLIVGAIQKKEEVA